MQGYVRRIEGARQPANALWQPCVASRSAGVGRRTLLGNLVWKGYTLRHCANVTHLSAFSPLFPFTCV